MNWYKLSKLVVSRYGGAEQERGIWYHGTSPLNLRAILSEGLITNPKKRNWDESPVSAGTFQTSSFASIGGIYVTKDLDVALGATYASEGEGKDSIIIVIMELQDRSLVADEDDINIAFQQSHSNDYNPRMPSLSPQKVAYLYFSILTNKNAGNIETEKNDYTNRCIQYLSKRLNDIPNELKEQVEKLTYDGWQYALCRQAAYLNDSDIKSFINMSGNLPDSKEMYDKLRSMLPDKQEAERNYKNYIDKATRTLKNLSRQYSIKFKDRSHTARSLNNIGYSGSNKIISIVQVYGNQQKIKQIYGQVPSQFMSDWAKVKQNELV